MTSGMRCSPARLGSGALSLAEALAGFYGRRGGILPREDAHDESKLLASWFRVNPGKST